MAKQKKQEEKKRTYARPVLTKHGKLKDVTAGGTSKPILGCTRQIL